MPGLLIRSALRRLRCAVFNRCVLVLLLLATPALVPDLLAQDFYRLSAQAETSTVRVLSKKQEGLGVAIGGGLLVATCAHVVKDSEYVDVYFSMGKTKGYVVEMDETDDIAIVRILTPLPPVKINQSTELLPVDSFILEAGIPKGTNYLDLRLGRVLAHFNAANGNYMVSAKTQPGFSGGPVFDAQGMLLGLVKGYAYIGSAEGTEVIPGHKISSFCRRISNSLNNK